MQARTVIIHGLADARMACAVASKIGIGLTLHSAPDAAANMGPLWFQQIIVEIAAEFPGIALDTVFDCGDSPGYALAALRQGLVHIRYTGPPVSRQKVVEIARRCGARVETAPAAPPAFEPLDHADPEAAFREWVRGKNC